LKACVSLHHLFRGEGHTSTSDYHLIESTIEQRGSLAGTPSDPPFESISIIIDPNSQQQDMSGSDFGNIPQSILDKWMTEAESGDRPRRPDVAIPVTIVLGLAVIIFVATRAWVRFRIQKKVDVADWLIFITAPMTLAYLIMVAVCVQQYYNRHLWELSDMERVVALKVSMGRALLRKASTDESQSTSFGDTSGTSGTRHSFAFQFLHSIYD
jgi:hypothetical protein